tara:strand:+ start:403 stop:930 length:528 start_codon:yes stop_codon:yes gene_type:complete
VKLHLGCGKRDFGSGWINIDHEDFDHIHSNSVTTLPFEDNSCDLIYSCHLLEYFDKGEAVEVLREWRRVLKPEATLRLAVPDFEQLCNLYKCGYSLDKVIGPLYGKWGNPAVYHKTTYDFRSLKNTLIDSGFRRIKRYNWRDTDHAEHDDHSQAYLPHMDKENGVLISLNVECVK